MNILTAILACTALAAGSAYAATPVDKNDRYTRLNPKMAKADPRPVEIANYPFLHRSANYIDFNGDDWTALRHKFATLGQRGNNVVTIVHIGDSHIQGDGNTGQVRKHMQNTYGNAGRGLMSPLRIAGTNQPMDYTLTTKASCATATLLKKPWRVPMGFTGAAVRPSSSQASFTLTDKSDFNELRIYTNGPVKVTSVSSNDAEVPATTESKEWGAQINLESPVKSLTFTLSGDGMILYGVDARDTRQPGVLYHAIGNNGATFQTYSRLGTTGSGVHLLNPDLIIISLGSNEAFGNVTDQAFYNMVDKMVTDIRTHNPQAKILLTSPGECQRSAGRSGKVASRAYAVNSNVERLGKVILKYGKDHNIATYDFFDVAGGTGSSNHWLQKGLLSRDRIHRTWNGYYLEGNLIYNALYKALTGKEIPEEAPVANPADVPAK